MKTLESSTDKLKPIYVFALNVISKAQTCARLLKKGIFNQSSLTLVTGSFSLFSPSRTQTFQAFSFPPFYFPSSLSSWPLELLTDSQERTRRSRYDKSLSADPNCEPLHFRSACERRSLCPGCWRGRASKRAGGGAWAAPTSNLASPHLPPAPDTSLSVRTPPPLPSLLMLYSTCLPFTDYNEGGVHGVCVCGIRPGHCCHHHHRYSTFPPFYQIVLCKSVNRICEYRR